MNQFPNEQWINGQVIVPYRPRIKQNAMLHKPSGRVIVSAYRHDWNQLDFNGKMLAAVDGGLDYLKRATGEEYLEDDWEDISVTDETPQDEANYRYAEAARSLAQENAELRERIRQLSAKPKRKAKNA